RLREIRSREEAVNRKHPRPTGASSLALLGAGLVFTSAEIGWADDTTLGAPERTLPAGQTRLPETTPTPERRPAEHAPLLRGGEAEEEPDAIRKLRQALEQRDAAIEHLRAGLEQRDAAIADLLAR